jgi:hypothetical protein
VLRLDVDTLEGWNVVEWEGAGFVENRRIMESLSNLLYD